MSYTVDATKAAQLYQGMQTAGLSTYKTSLSYTVGECLAGAKLGSDLAAGWVTTLGAWAINTNDSVSFFSSFPSSMTYYDMVIEAWGDAGVSGLGSSSSSGQTITGTADDDTLEGGTGKDTITGGAGNDLIDAGTGNDKAYGGSGDDTIDGGEGSDYMEGQSGADTYYVDNKKDTVKESDNLPEDSSGLILESDIGSTIDTVISSVKYTLTNYVENLTLTGASKIDGTGNNENNTLTGNSESNKLTGKLGNDSLDGGAGNDTLSADAGADTLNGGSGTDKLKGGADADIFILSSLNTSSAEADAIADFTDADTLKIDTSVFIKLDGATADNLAIDKKTADLDANDYLIYDSKTGSLYYDADGSGATSTAVKIVAIKGTDAKTFTFDDLLLS